MRQLFDVTETSETPALSGIQRVVRDFSCSLPSAWELVRFDAKTSTFRIVDSIPDISYRTDSGIRRKLRHLAKEAFLQLAVLADRRHTRDIPGGASSLAKAFFDRFLADSYIRESSRWRKGPVWTGSNGDQYFTMEYLTKPQHRAALRQLAEECGVQASFYVHDIIPLTNPELFSRRSSIRQRGNFMDYLELVFTGSEIIANSEATRADYVALRKILSPSSDQKMRVVYPLVSRPTAPDNRLLKARNSWPKDPGEICILGVGALDARKNFEVAVRALHILLSSGQRARLVIVGGSQTRPTSSLVRLLAGATQNQRESFVRLGSVPQDELEALYRWADVVVVPSKAEGFGLPVIEAVVRGVPVIASDIRVFREIAVPKIVTLLPASDPVSWAEAILRVSSDKTLREGVDKHNAVQKYAYDYSDYMARIMPVTGSSPR